MLPLDYRKQTVFFLGVLIVNNMDNPFPRNAAEWQRYTSRMQQQRSADITNKQSINPLQGQRIQETRPVPSYTPSKNWNEAIWKGYNTPSDLSTYILPRHEQLQLALFSRYILKDNTAADSEYLAKAQEKFREQKEYKTIKRFAREKNASFNQGVVMNPKVQIEDGIETEVNEPPPVPPRTYRQRFSFKPPPVPPRKWVPRS